MALANITNQMERDKFVENSSDETAIRVVMDQSQVDSIKPSTVGEVAIKEKVPVDDTKVNPSTVLGYDVDDNLSTITRTIGTTEYQQTLTYTAGVLTGISEWVEL